MVEGKECQHERTDIRRTIIVPVIDHNNLIMPTVQQYHNILYFAPPENQMLDNLNDFSDVESDGFVFKLMLPCIRKKDEHVPWTPRMTLFFIFRYGLPIYYRAITTKISREYNILDPEKVDRVVRGNQKEKNV